MKLLLFTLLAAFATAQAFQCVRLIGMDFFDAPNPATTGNDCKSHYDSSNPDVFSNFKTNQTFLQAFGQGKPGQVCARMEYKNYCTGGETVVFGLANFTVELNSNGELVAQNIAIDLED